MPDAEPVPGERVEFDIGGLRIAGDRWAAADQRGTVVLLHGGGQTRHSWHRTGAWLSGAGWTAVSLDARGHGDSDWAPDGDYSANALVGDLRGVLAQLDTTPVLVGASMGGGTAMLAQGEGGDLAGGLVLVDIAPRVEPPGVARIKEFMTAHAAGFASLDEVAAAVRAYNPHRTRPPSEAGLRKNVRLADDGRWYWHWDPAFILITDEPTRAERAERARDAAARITVPTMLVRGRHSDIVSDESVAELLELVPHARYVDVGGAGHMVAGDDNDVFTEHLLDFLDTVADGTAAEGTVVDRSAAGGRG